MNQHQDDSDPYDWSIDKVVVEVAQEDCRLAESLRLNEVDGEVLLTVCTYERLKDDIGIIPLGKRSKIMRTIDGLRKRSYKYRDYILDLASNTALPDDAVSVIGSPIPKSVGFEMSDRIRSLDIPSFATPTNHRKRKSGAMNGPLTSLDRPSATPEPHPQLTLTPLPHPSTSLRSQLQPPEPSAEVQVRQSKPLGLLAAEDDNLPLFVPKSALHFPDHVAVRIVRNRATGEADVVPFSQGRAFSESPTEERVGGGMEMDLDYEYARSPSPAERLSGGHGPDGNDEDVNVQMDMSPDSIETEGVEERGGAQELDKDSEIGREISNKPSKVKGISRKRRYLPSKGLTADELIYGKIEVGMEIHSDEGEDEFFIQSSHQPHGQQRYVERQIRYLLRSAESTTTVHQGHLRAGIKPYKENLVLKHYHQAVTLYNVQKDGSCKVYKENTATVELPWGVVLGTTSSSSDVQVVRFLDQPKSARPKLDAGDNSIHDWDYLLKWQNIEDDKELPLLGESGSEGEYSVETWKEMEAEIGPQERPLGKSNREPLTESEIKEVLDEGVKLIIDNWRNKVLPRKEAQAYRIYCAAKKRKERKKTARDAKARIEELDQRLEKMRVELCGVVWTRKAFVKKQVAIMQPTVVDREEQKWLGALMERSKIPEKPEKVTRTKTIEEGDQEMIDDEDGDDEESLGSTSEDDYSDEDGEMDGFIVADNVRDMVNGVELEVEGEKEVEEELAKKAAENEMVDSSDSEDGVPIQGRRLRDQSRSKAFGEDHFMGGMDDVEEGEIVEDINRVEEVIIPTPKLDKGKGKAKEDSPVPNLKEEPPATQAFVINTPKKNIPIIDLTMDDSPDSTPRRKSKGQVIDLMGENDDEGEMPLRKFSPHPITLAKLVRSKSDPQLEAIWYRLEEVKPNDLFTTVTVVAGQIHMNKIKNVPGLDEYEPQSEEMTTEALRFKEEFNRYNAQVYRMLAQLYIAWAIGRTDMKKKLEPDEFTFIDSQTKFGEFRNVLIDTLRTVRKGFERQKNIVEPDLPEPKNDLRNDKTRKRLKNGASRLVDFEFDEIDEDSTPGHRKRKPPKLNEDVGAKEKRERLNVINRRITQRAKAQEKKDKLAGVERSKIIVNIGKYARQNDIYFHDSFAKVLKPHQIEGIKFMWKNLIQTGENRGALLAHTMGLGKTLQVIALLYTIATAAGSDDKKTWEQIPEHLRKSRTLILSPPGLVENWCDEFENWLPTKPDSDDKDLENIGPIVRADSTLKIEDRLAAIQRWYKEGGVLLTGYQTFRNHVMNMQPQLAEESHTRVKNMLLNGPNIIIADEAHQLKNPKAKISDAARGFKSMSRIAMTGSPLSNNLMEYWSMIDWIDPFFLGPRKEFEQKYVQPIEDGLYADSSVPEKRKCLKMLRVLRTDISPKVHRMDISVIEKDLPMKTEFLIKVPLTGLQMDMYKRFLVDPTTTGQSSPTDIRGTPGLKFFDAIHLLSLICNHPVTFVETLEGREKKNQSSKGKKPLIDDELQDLDDLDDLDSPKGDIDDLLSTTNKPYPWAREVMNSVKDQYAINLSHKVLLVKHIVDNAIAVKDQVLIFTHSVPSLNLLERFLKQENYSYHRLDGHTPMFRRQTMTKVFNQGTGNVCLISTEAGGLGLNLPGANRIIIFDFKWSPMWEEQAVGRGYRLGQKKHVFVYRFQACGTYEEKMRNRVLFKNQLHSRIVESRDPIRAATKEGKDYFFEPYEVERKDLTEFRGKDPRVLDKIIDGVDFIRSIDYTETFLRDEEDILTEEEIRETDEMLKAERASRGVQGQQDEIARKSDEEYRKANAEILRLAEQSELQIKQEMRLKEMRNQSTNSRQIATPLTPLNAPSQAPIPNQIPAKASVPSAKNPAPPAPAPARLPPPPPRGFVAPLSPTVAGRTKSGPETPSRVVRVNDAPPVKTPLATNKSSTAPAQNDKIPSTTSLPLPPQRTGTHGLTPVVRKNTIPSSSQPVPKHGPLVSREPLAGNKFGLKFTELPKVFKSDGKDSTDKNTPNKNGDSSETGGTKKPSVGTLKLQG